MAIEKAIRDYLLSKTAVSDLVGDRIWPDMVRQEWRPTQGPCAVYEFIASDEEHGISDRSGFVSSRIQFTAYAGTRMSANATIRAIKNCGITALKGTYSGVSIRGVEIVSGIQTFVEKPDDGKENPRFLAEIDFRVHYLED